MEDFYLNPSSAAAALLQASGDPVPRARKALGKLLGASPEGFIFTSGASEANSWVAANLRPGAHVVASAIEHPSLRLSLEAAARNGADIAWVQPNADGIVTVDAALSAVRPDTALVSVMMANNETGAIQPVGAISRGVRDLAPACLVHTDATQAVGRVPIDLDDDLGEIDLLSMSAHKLHGPRGVGALYVRPDINLEPLIHGEQAWGRRGGTHNSPGIAGFAVAVEIAARRMACWQSHGVSMRDTLESRLLASHPGSWINSAAADRLPNTVSLTLPGVDAGDLVDRLALIGVCIATGAACSAGASEPPRTLIAMGLSHEDALSTLRLSLSLETSIDEVNLAIAEIEAVVRTIASNAVLSGSARC